MIQHEIIRAEAGKKLTKLNAEYELDQAQRRLDDFWGEAIARGVKVRRHGNLIRLQGLTSARVFGERANPPAQATEPPEASPATKQRLAVVMPFKSFSLDEEFA